MLALKSKHFLTGEELSREEMLMVIDQADRLRIERNLRKSRKSLDGMTLGLMFDKPSLRTRFSFTVAIQELGGNVVESLNISRKSEEPEDVARVLSGYCHALAVRTHGHTYLERMAKYSRIPIVNALSDAHHPCQVMADILTLKQSFEKLEGLTLTYIGDGNNMLHSLLLLMPFLGINVRYACPVGFEPSALIVKKAKERAKKGGATITALSRPEAACEGAHALYTDVWTSMGFEEKEAERERAFAGFQLNERLLEIAHPEAIVMHCMPMIRGKEISEDLPDHPRSALFRQSENRLHVQKALLEGLMQTQI